MKRWALRLPFAIAIGGAVYTATELLLQAQGLSLCSTQGCAVVQKLARFGEPSLLLAGVVLFVLLAILLSALARTAEMRSRRSTVLQVAIWCVLMVSMAAEGYLVGVQLFFAHAACVYCLGVLGTLLVLIIAYSVIYHDPVAFPAVAAFGAVVMVMFFVQPERDLSLQDTVASRIVKGGPSKQFYLIYSDKCSACHRVLLYCKEVPGNINMALCPIEKSRKIIDALGIAQIPVMIEDTGDRKEVLVGESNIIARLSKDETQETNAISKAWRPLRDNIGGMCNHAKPCG